jgi:S1-C subfamily serine protease
MKICLVLAAILLSSCVLYCCKDSLLSSKKYSLNEILPRDSFVKIRKTIKLTVCDANVTKLTQCGERVMGSTASGFIVAYDNEGSYVITAAHVCDDEEIKSYVRTHPGVDYSIRRFKLIDIDKDKYSAIVLNYDSETDICMLYSYGLFRTPVNISDEPPVPGDRAYNLAAPIGIFSEGMVPILNGYYNGVAEEIAIYSVPAVGGSSGSPIFNEKGELIGMIHSVYVRFPFLSLSPRFSELVSFIKNNTNKDILLQKKLFENLLF